ncbi:MAG TPA: TMEM165/GDT1 family protein [Acidimicrobiales bacterium]|nr:TMEM165/GDT1 family protein [Acidimicrobiales bacterium]
MESLLAALGVVFLAELGDKTQLVALGFGARYRLAPVLTGVVAAYMCTNLLSVIVGGLLGAALPTRAIGLVGGVLFIGFGIWTLRTGGEEEDEAAADEAGTDGAVATDERHVIASVATAMFLAELGDKTMLATATLAAQGNPVLVWIGATTGIILAGVLGVLVGRVFGARLPERATRIGSAILFAAVGVGLIVANL